MFAAISGFMFDNLKKDFSCNKQKVGFCVKKRLFAAFNEKAKLRLFVPL